MRPPSSGSSGLRQSAASKTTPSPGFSGAMRCASAGAMTTPLAVTRVDASHQHAAMARCASLDDGLVVGAVDEMGAEPARIDLFEPQFGGGDRSASRGRPRLRRRPGDRRRWSARRSRRPCSGLRSSARKCRCRRSPAPGAARRDRRARADSARRPSGFTRPSTSISYGRRQACAHWPRLALRPPQASDEKHWPE